MSTTIRRCLAGCLIASAACAAHADCESTFTLSETQGSVKAKLACLAEEVQRLQLELNASRKENEQLRNSGGGGNSPVPSGATYFGPIENKANCITSAKSWVASKNGTINGSDDSSYLFAYIGTELVYIACGFSADNVRGKYGSDIGFIVVTGPSEPTTTSLRDDFQKARSTPF